jgi:hypothetical protein
LALHKTVGELERTMSAREFQDWERIEHLNRYPLPDRLIDVHLARLCATLINVMTSQTEPARLIDYSVLPMGKSAPEEGLTDIDEIGAALDAMQGG